MHTTPPPWRKLVDLPGRKAVLAEWGEFPVELLVLTQEVASAVPCGNTGGCHRRVISHPDGELVGICSAFPVRCDRQPLNRLDVAVHRLDEDRLFKILNWVVGGRRQVEKLDWVPNLWRIATINAFADHAIPVFQTFGSRPTDVDHTVNAIAVRQKEAFLLITSVSTLTSTSAYERVESRNGRILGLDDLLVVTSSGEFKVRNRTKSAIERWKSSLAPASKAPGSEFLFPTPAGADWPNIKLEFIADEVILASCAKETRRIEPEHLQMKNQKSGRPTKQWLLLKTFAMCNGEIDWSNTQARESMNKQKEILCKKLKRAFGLSSPPIVWRELSQSYECFFRISQSLSKVPEHRGNRIANVA